jgi:hypothetical protein
LKYISPGLQVAGRTVPAFTGFVEVAPEKSTPLAWLRKSICVCAAAVRPTKAKKVALSIRSLHP